jgi:hypothetical protein
MKRFIPILTATMLIWTLAHAAGDKPQAGDDKGSADKAAEIAAAASMPTKAKGGDCIFSRTISNWDSLDDETLIIWAPSRHDPYLVKLWMPAFGLKSEFNVGILDADNDGQLCDYGRDAIVVSEPGGPQRYKIRTLQRLDEAQAQAMLDSHKRKKQPEPAATLPEQSDVKSDKQN